MFTEDTRIIDLTVGQLIELMTNIKKQEEIKNPVKSSTFCGNDYFFGYSELAKELGCSTVTIYDRLKSGVYDSAIIRNGRKILFKKDKIKEILESKTQLN